MTDPSDRDIYEFESEIGSIVSFWKNIEPLDVYSFRQLGYRAALLFSNLQKLKERRPDCAREGTGTLIHSLNIKRM